MVVKIVNGKIVITLDQIKPPRLSSSGKTLLVATTSGNKETELKIGGKSVYVGCNCYVYKEDKKG